MPKGGRQQPWIHVLLIALWTLLGAVLRFANLAAKPPWNDEIATLGFSLGNSFYTIPLNQPLDLDTLLQPLRPNPAATMGTVIQRLMTESTHPPVYFILSHWWLQLFPAIDGLVSVWGARSLSALFGIVTIPAMFGLGWLTFRSWTAAHLAAVLMAVSPFGIYLAQEARHYTLTLLVIIASLSCLVVATRTLQSKTPTPTALPNWLIVTWILVNGLGIAIHYFFALTLGAEILVLLGLLRSKAPSPLADSLTPTVAIAPRLHPSFWVVIGGSLLGGLVWLPALRQVSGNELTQWIFSEPTFGDRIVGIGRWIGWIITMVMMLPVEGTPVWVTVISGTIAAVFVLGLLTFLILGLKFQSGQLEAGRSTRVLLGFFGAAIGLFAIVIYLLGADLTIAARYHFVYFPAVIVLVAGALAVCWDEFKLKEVVVIVLLFGLAGSLTVVTNFGYQKPDRPDLMVPIIQQEVKAPILIANTHQNHEQIRELMGLGLEFKKQMQQQQSTSIAPAPADSPQFLLAHQKPHTQTGTQVLQQTINELAKPLDVWVVNFLPVIQPRLAGCMLDVRPRPTLNGYNHRLYHCS